MPDASSRRPTAARLRTALACLAPVLAGAGGLLLATARPDGRDEPAGGDDLMRTVGTARTDAGRAVRLCAPRSPRGPAEVAADEARLLADLGYAHRLPRTGPPGESTNCHGWVFTGGRFWVEPGDAERILADNGYGSVADPRPGDLAVYRQNGRLAHVAVVREPAADPAAVVVEGKWGWMGVFRHPAGDCAYGPPEAFYRSPRPEHLLAGLPPDPDGSAADDAGSAAARPAAN